MIDVDNTQSLAALVGVGKLFRDSVDLFRIKIWKLLGLQAVQLLTLALVGFGSGIILSSGSTVSIWIIGTILFAVMVAVLTFVTLASVYIIDSKIGLKEALAKTAEHIFGYWWVALLMTLVIYGGMMLLIIPGIIFSVSLIFAVYTFALEGKKGLAALNTSTNLVRGVWWAVALRMSFLFLIVFGISIASGILGAVLGESIGEIFGFLFNTLLTPFGMIYMYLLYKNTVNIRGEGSPKNEKSILIILASLGVIAFTVIIWALNLVIVASKNLTTQQQIQLQDIENLENFDLKDLNGIESFDPSVFDL